MRYFVELSYRGTAYHGWQNQPNAISVQEVLEKAFGTLLGRELSLVGAGRTDTGVHARLMVAHFDFDEEIDEIELCYRLNAFLPEDISIGKIFRVRDDAHARFSAELREYNYFVHQEKDPFLSGYSHFFKPKLDLELMNSAAESLLSHRNFKCFSRSNTDVKTYNCDVKTAKWIQEGYRLTFTISADRFLRNMVRAVVGTLLDVGLKKMSLTEFMEVLQSEDRSQAGASVPAHGLYLTGIEYPQSILIS